MEHVEGATVVSPFGALDPQPSPTRRRTRAADGGFVRTTLGATRLDDELHLEDRDGRPVLASAAREGT